MKRLLNVVLVIIFCFTLSMIVVPAQLAAADTVDTKLNASDAAASDFLGYYIDIDGDTIVASARYDDDGATNSGSAYVFTRSGGGWAQQAKLNASDPGAEDLFGVVAISGDTVVVGAFQDDDGGTNSGSAYVFTRSGGVWTEQTKLTASDGTAGDRFGYSVDISGDTMVAGAKGVGPQGTGAAYVFTRSGTTWTEQAKLTASDGDVIDEFGYVVSIDGDTVIAGAWLDDDGGTNSGSAYVFTRSGGVWTEQTKLTASDGAAYDQFGTALDISGDTVIVSSRVDDDKGGASGSAYVFTRSGTAWTEQAKLTASDGDAIDWFGVSVATKGDTSVVGAWNDDDNGTNSGSAYVFTRSGITWSEHSKLTASDGAANDVFGASVAIDGATVVIGAHEDDDVAENTGSVYVDELAPTITSISPTQADQDETIEVTMTGTFFGGATAVSLGTGITINSYTVDSATQITADITVAAGAASGTRDVAVTTPGGTGTLTDGFTVNAVEPTVTAVSPLNCDQGDTSNVTITGTYFSGATAVSLGDGITINSYTVDSVTQITANITVGASATIGTRDVSVTTPGGTDTIAGGFALTAAEPTVTAATPAEAKQGSTLQVTITGTYLTGATAVSFGSGITVNEYTVNSATQITADITIADAATKGTRDIVVTTPGGADTISGGFAVEQSETSGGGCRASAAAASTSKLASGWGIVGLLGVSGIYTHRRRKK